jgi:ketosteroid isomerase-like protein
MGANMHMDDRSTIERALATFVDAFGSLDRARMEASFTDDATVFHPMKGPRQPGFWTDEFDTWRAIRPGPPYVSIDPKDLQIQTLDDVAIVTFHLDTRPGELWRRTLVLAKTTDGWKIAHLHASVMPTGQ